MNSEVEQFIRQKVQWNKLPSNVKMSLANSQKEYDKAIVTFSIKNQLRYKGNLVRHVRKDEEQRYYEELLAYSRASLLLYPYHLSDIMVKGLRVTPFQYYTKVLENIMENERSYDSLPNFTAADCLRLLGIGRNEYIDLMNQCRSSRKLFRRKNVKDLLPVKPVDINIEPWWLVEIGCIVEDDIKIVSQAEKQVIDKLIDIGKPQRAGDLDHNLVHSLYKKGLIYLEVPIDEDDYIVVPPLEGFVMNRVLGDYFETLLYKIFVSIDERTSVGELANVLQIDPSAVKQAVSLYCRFGFARKKVPESDDWHPTWNPAQSIPKSPSTDVPCFSKVYAGDQTSEEGDSNLNQDRRIAFLFDSTLTAFLMMGNLSPGLKSHAVTMFEVGKLTDESMDSFLCELEKVSTVRDESEGEARRYFEHALVLRSTVQALRQTTRLDLVRYESLHSLDKPTLSRLIKKNYSLLVSMAPLSGEVVPLISRTPPHLGPPCPLSNTPWFKLFVYSLTSSGPPSILFARGQRVNKVPRIFRSCERVLLTSWAHDPTVVPTSNLLYSLNDSLTYSPVLLQALGNSNVFETQLVPFPFPEVPEKGEMKDVNWLEHRGLSRLYRDLDLGVSCGYLTMIKAGTGSGWYGGNINTIPTKPNTPVRHDMSQLNLFLKPHEVGLACALDTPATPSSLDAWIQTISSGMGEVNIKHYSPVKEENEPMNGITNQECAEILEQELDKLTTPTHSPSPDSSPSRGECKDEVCSLGSLGGVVSGSRADTTASPLHVSDWVLLDCKFGVPLFDAYLNSHVTSAIIDRLSQRDSLEKSIVASDNITEKLTEFIQKLQQDHGIEIERDALYGNKENGTNIWPSTSIMFFGGELQPWDDK